MSVMSVTRCRTAITVLLALLVAGTAAAPASAASTSSDRAVARAGLLALTDFPSGWHQGKRGDTSNAELDAKAAKIASCKPFMAFSKANRGNPHASSPDFSHDQSSVTNAVSVYPSIPAATAAMTDFSDPGLPVCLDQLFTRVFRGELAKTKSVARQITGITTDIKPIAGVRIGDEALVYQGPVTITLKSGAPESMGIGVMSVRTGRAIDGYSWTSDVGIETALQPAIVASVGRLQQAASAG
jgi:hypothetical protein